MTDPGIRVNEANRTIILLRAALKRSHIPGTINPIAIAMCDIIDHYIGLVWHERDRAFDEMKRLRERIERLETKGDQE